MTDIKLFNVNLPELRITAQAYSDLFAVVDLFGKQSNEIGFYCKYIINGNTILITTIDVPPQVVTTGSFRANPEHLTEKFKTDPTIANLLGCSCEIHSHNNMGVFASSKDDENFAIWCNETYRGYFIYGIVNCKRETLFKIFDAQRGIYWTSEIKIELPKASEDLLSVAKQRIVEPKPVCVKTESYNRLRNTIDYDDDTPFIKVTKNKSGKKNKKLVDNNIPTWIPHFLSLPSVQFSAGLVEFGEATRDLLITLPELHHLYPRIFSSVCYTMEDLSEKFDLEDQETLSSILLSYATVIRVGVAQKKVVPILKLYRTILQRIKKTED